MALVRNCVISLIATLFLVDDCASWNVSLVPQSVYDGADDNCTSRDDSTLIPLPVLLDVNMSVLMEMLNVNESAWIGGVSYKGGCKNTTSDDDAGECSDIVHQRLPTNTKLNFSCVHGDVIELFKSPESKTFNDSAADCGKYGGTSRLPSINDKYLPFQLPAEIRGADRGPQWFGTVDDGRLKGRMASTCRFVTKIDECTLRIESGSCTFPEKKGICYHDTGMNFHSTLEFIKYDAQTGNIFDDTRIIEDQSLCSAAPTIETTEAMTRNAYTSEALKRNAYETETTAYETETTERNAFTTDTMGRVSDTEPITSSTDSVSLSSGAPDSITTETTQLGQTTTSYSQQKTTTTYSQQKTTTSYSQQKPTTEDIETSTRTFLTTSKGGTVPSTKPRGSSNDSSNLWIIPVVLIILLVLAIVAVIIVMKRRRRGGMVTRSEGRQDNSMMQITDPVLVEVEPEEIEIIDLDEDNKEPLNANGDTIKRISVRSTISDHVLEEKEPEEIEIIDIDENNKEPPNSNGDTIKRKSVRSDDGDKNQPVFVDVSNENKDQTNDEIVP